MAKRIALFLTLSIFCIVFQAWADTTETSKSTFYEGSIIKMSGNEEDDPADIRYETDEQMPGSAFLESSKKYLKIKLTETLEKIFSIYKFYDPPWHQSFDSQRFKETKPSDLEYGSPTLNPYSKDSRSLEEGTAQMSFELLQSKLKKTEIFMLFNLSFGSKTELLFLEMRITPSSDKGVNFFIPF
ncbi:MAG: hypothetical protein ACE144_05225 [Thermodesulfobacteriota bacterium]